ncbi:MAG: FliM/FliN family flagellar motor switch protein [Paracoccaceae bacterium]
MGVPVELVISVGRARPLIGELLKLRRDSVLTLDSRIEDPVEIFVGDRLIARGELQEMDGEPGKLGVRLIEIVDLIEGA